jgi:uncharacterized protein
MATDLTDAELDRLEQYLNAPERIEATLPLDAVQALLCAVSSAPAPIARERWIAAVLGPGHQFATPAEAAQITALLERFQESTARQLNEGEGFDFILYGTEDDENDLAAWAEGYLMGVDLADPAWEDEADPDDLERILFPFLALTGEAKEMALEEGEAWMDEAEEKRMMKEVSEGLADHLLDVRRYWFDKSIPGTVRRESPKVGRNDPCPCGSGKKFKNCCEGTQ